MDDCVKAFNIGRAHVAYVPLNSRTFGHGFAEQITAKKADIQSNDIMPFAEKDLR
jgi:hypothetical protein